MDLIHFMKQNFSNIFVSEADRFDQNIAKGGEVKKKLYNPLNQADLMREVMIFSDSRTKSFEEGKDDKNHVDLIREVMIFF